MRSFSWPRLPFSSQEQSRRVCIIGAGVSGLRAAALLVAAGFKVIVLEARDHVGGRIHQKSRFGPQIDLGASWMHGTQGNPIIDLARKANSTFVACGAVYSICDSSGAWLDSETARCYYEEVWEILDMAIDESCKKAVSLPDTAKMMDFFRQEVGKRREHVKQPDVYETLMLQIVEMWGAFMGNECENQSLKNIWLDAGLEGDNLFMASTFKDIVADLLRPVTNGATLRLGCEVTKIENNRVGVVDVGAADGFRDTFDDVIVTAPLGWLKRNENVFTPLLTPRISTAIHSLGYGNLDRVFIKFPKAFWNTQASETNDCPRCIPEKNQGPAFPIESLFLRPGYATDTNPAEWRLEIISFSGLPEPFAQPVIMFFIYGQWGRHITGLVRGMTQNSGEYYRILNDNFRPYYSKLPNYDPASSECRPLEFMSTDWQDDKLAGFGSFTNMPIGSGDCSQHFEALREGMGQDRGIWFAGEHTSPPGGLGTVTGAYWSGEEVAKRVGRRHDVTIPI